MQKKIRNSFTQYDFIYTHDEWNALLVFANVSVIVTRGS